MSLVAYEASSDEESDENQDQPSAAAVVIEPMKRDVPAQQSSTATRSGHISDDEDYMEYMEHSGNEEEENDLAFLKSKAADMGVNNTTFNTFAKLPIPSTSIAENNDIVEEDDDEFLHKKATPIQTEEKPLPPPQLRKSGPVKITIPALKDFKDVDQDLASTRNANKEWEESQSRAGRGCGLLSLLPKAKSERVFNKTSHISPTGNGPQVAPLPSSSTFSQIEKEKPALSKPAFIPDAVKYRRPAYNTEGVDGFPSTSGPKAALKKKAGDNPDTKQTNKTAKEPARLGDRSDSEDDGGDDVNMEDFFSLNGEDKLPEVNTNEIQALVAKRAAEMANAKTQYEFMSNALESQVLKGELQEEADGHGQRKRYYAAEQKLEAEAMEALEGSSAAKRRRKQAQHNEVEIVDIRGDEVLPNREEWMRTALASATTYQPTGVLADEEPAAGTRRKHQITYLAHKAKINEAELQAMWAANRQNRRATQSKYGF